MELIINHRSICEGGPAHITVPDGATTVGRAIALFKEQTGVTCPVRLKTAQRVLRSTDTLDEVGIAGGHALTAVKHTNGSPHIKPFAGLNSAFRGRAAPTAR